MSFSFTRVYAQDSSVVEWTASGKKIADKQYALSLKGTIKRGWHIYSKANVTAGFEGLKIFFFDSSITTEGSLQITGNTRTITDKIFDNVQTEITEENVEVVLKINLPGIVPSNLKARLLYNTASESAYFVPEEMNIEVSME